MIEQSQGRYVIEIYSTLILGENEFAINVSEIQEVVNFPDNFKSMPLAPAFLIGVFNLRNMIIPMVDLSVLLNYSSTVQLRNKKLAIVDYDGAKIGLLFDATGEVLRIKDEVLSEFNYTEHSIYRVVKGVIRISEKRLLQILNIKALFTIENIPHIADYQRKYGDVNKSLKIKKKKCIIFSVGKSQMSIEIEKIFEIVKVDQIKQSALQTEICLGFMHLRNLIVPLVDFHRIVNFNFSLKAIDDFNDRRAIVLKMGEAYLGLLVDSVDNIFSFSDEEILPIPMLSKIRQAMFKGCISDKESGDHFLLDADKILSTEELTLITKGHSKLYSDQSLVSEKMLKSKVSRMTYITFRLINLFGFRINEVQEIINFPQDIFDSPGMPLFVEGMINLRGNLITIVNLRKLYGINQLPAPEIEKKVIILKIDQDFIGLVVDSVESIAQISFSDKMRLPDIFMKGAMGHFQQDVQEIVEINSDSNEIKSKALIILDKNKMLVRIQNFMSEKSETETLEETFEQVD